MELHRRGVLRRDARFLGEPARPVLPVPRDPTRCERVLLALIAGVSEVIIDWVWHGMTDPPEPLVEDLTAFGVSVMAGLRS
ncbi:hypothetical protein AB0M46_43615 [Dactylosporangium sp. NPDC051485]|uniref:hypothetical protein n=1 Tax=Dactylosporangium sp. NPDC051485 TaxID=3154846 RepID=UPI003431A130